MLHAAMLCNKVDPPIPQGQRRSSSTAVSGLGMLHSTPCVSFATCTTASVLASLVGSRPNQPQILFECCSLLSNADVVGCQWILRQQRCP